DPARDRATQPSDSPHTVRSPPPALSAGLPGFRPGSRRNVGFSHGRAGFFPMYERVTSRRARPIVPRIRRLCGFTSAFPRSPPVLRPAPATAPAPERRPKYPGDEAGFLDELQRRVAAYFARTGRPERDCWQMYLKTAVVLGWFAASYVLLVFFATSVWVAIPLTLSLACALAAVAFNVQHDGGHHAVSRFEWVNRLAAYTLDLIGASSYLWKWKHGVFHHTYANISGQDTDIEAGAVARLCPHQERRWFHRWQHLYLWPLYGLTASRWHLWGDFKDVITGKIGAHRIPRPKGWDLVGFLGGKVLSIGLLLALPMFFQPWWLVLLFY